MGIFSQIQYRKLLVAKGPDGLDSNCGTWGSFWWMGNFVFGVAVNIATKIASLNIFNGGQTSTILALWRHQSAQTREGRSLFSTFSHMFGSLLLCISLSFLLVSFSQDFFFCKCYFQKLNGGTMRIKKTRNSFFFCFWNNRPFWGKDNDGTAISPSWAKDFGNCSFFWFFPSLLYFVHEVIWCYLSKRNFLKWTYRMIGCQSPRAA